MVKRSKQSHSASHSKWVLLLLIQLIQTIYTSIVVGDANAEHRKAPKGLLVDFQPLENIFGS